MKYIIIFLIFLVVHIIVCLLFYFGLRSRFFKFSNQLMPIIMFVPVWGPVIGIIAQRESVKHRTGSMVIQMEEMRAEESDYRIKRIQEEDSLASIVPLEEAILINDTATRRQMMLDILRQNPGQYIQLLRQASLNDDIDVTHYASTAIMELQREYEVELQRREKDLGENPENAKALSDLLLTIRRYIDSGLIEDRVLYIQRIRYSSLLEQQIQANPDDMNAMIEAADNYMELSDFTTAKEIIDLIISKWPANENTFFLKLKYCQKTNNGELLRNTVEQIKKSNIYLSAEGRNILAFWSKSLDDGVAI